MFTLQNLKIVLNIKDAEQDDLLNLVMKKIENSLLADLQIDCLNSKSKTLALDLSAQQYYKIKKIQESNGNISVSAADNEFTQKSII